MESGLFWFRVILRNSLIWLCHQVGLQPQCLLACSLKVFLLPQNILQNGNLLLLDIIVVLLVCQWFCSIAHEMFLNLQLCRVLLLSLVNSYSTFGLWKRKCCVKYFETSTCKGNVKAMCTKSFRANSDEADWLFDLKPNKWNHPCCLDGLLTSLLG